MSGEEHKAFESIRKKKVDFDPKIEKLLKDAHSFISGLYSIQTGKELPWKTEDVDLNVNEDEIILRIKRH